MWLYLRNYYLCLIKCKCDQPQLCTGGNYLLPGKPRVMPWQALAPHREILDVLSHTLKCEWSQGFPFVVFIKMTYAGEHWLKWNTFGSTRPYNGITWVSSCLKLLVTQLFVHQHVQVNNKEKKDQVLHYWLFVRGIQWWLVDSPHQGLEMQKILPCCDVTMC